MNLQELILSNAWLSVEYTLVELYPEEEENIDAYQEVFEKLQMMTGEYTGFEIVLTECEESYDGLEEPERYVDVSGKNIEGEEPGTYAIEFEPWSHWLGMIISAETLENFSELEIIAHCLFEMTFISFDEEEIEDRMDELEEQRRDYESMTPEERESGTVSLDEIMKLLNPDSEDPDSSPEED